MFVVELPGLMTYPKPIYIELTNYPPDNSFVTMFVLCSHKYDAFESAHEPRRALNYHSHLCRETHTKLNTKSGNQR